ncbi:MAG: hypothetical protein VX642_10095 [Bdellovibrionota bacterium]|nr:hypothetical protein [Bdellovibrionota bacterium]
MSSKSKSDKTEIAAGLKNSLESLQASLDEWAAVEKEVKSAPKADESEKKNSKKADPELISKLMQQIENLSL